MFNFLCLFEPWQWAVLIVSAVCLGISRTGLNGVSIVAIPLAALVFGGKESTGIVLIWLCFADVFAVIYYRRHAAWKYIWRLIPWTLAGIGIALVVDHFISSNRVFKILIGLCIIAGLLVTLWNERQNKEKIPSGLWFSALFGILGGFATMIGNAAAPLLAVFLLTVRLPKESFVGTNAWYFLIINYLKIPLQIFLWNNIHLKTLMSSVTMIPFILLGLWLGIIFVKKVNNKQYRIAVYVLTVFSAIILFL